MKNVFENVLDVVGNTPLVRLHTMTKGLQANVYAKVEFTNPGGSVKDRIAMHIIDEAEDWAKSNGCPSWKPQVETRVPAAMVAAMRGYKQSLCFPTSNRKKRAALRAWGARVVVTPTNVEPDDPRSYYKTAERLVEETPTHFTPISTATRPIRKPTTSRPGPNCTSN